MKKAERKILTESVGLAFSKLRVQGDDIVDIKLVAKKQEARLDKLEKMVACTHEYKQIQAVVEGWKDKTATPITVWSSFKMNNPAWQEAHTIYRCIHCGHEKKEMKDESRDNE